jgi:hypothetical protein
VTALWGSVAKISIPARFAILGVVIFHVIGGIVGLVIGLNAYAPTAWFAVFEVGMPAGIVGGVLGVSIGGCVLLVRRLNSRRHVRG